MLRAAPSVAIERIKQMREALLRAASSVQYESANEPGIQMGLTHLLPDPLMCMVYIVSVYCKCLL